MPIASMTGFSREAGTSGPYQWVWELKSVNGRGLEVRIRTPAGYDALGEEARKNIHAAITRGQCQLNLSLSKTATLPSIRINEDILQSLMDSVGRLQLPEGIGKASLDGLLTIRGVVEADETQDTTADETLMWDLRTALDRLVMSLVSARNSEGQALEAIILGHLSTIEELVGQAEAAPGRQPEAIASRLRGQIELLLGDKSSFDENRLYQEALIMAAKADVREEIDRLRAHVEAARELLENGGPVGRRLDFLAQELGREANTLCAKANDISLSRTGLELKAIVEQFREQVQNVE